MKIQRIFGKGYFRLCLKLLPISILSGGHNRGFTSHPLSWESAFAGIDHEASPDLIGEIVLGKRAVLK
jgi:hypothetical protein